MSRDPGQSGKNPEHPEGNTFSSTKFFLHALHYCWLITQLLQMSWGLVFSCFDLGFSLRLIPGLVFFFFSEAIFALFPLDW